MRVLLSTLLPARYAALGVVLLVSGFTAERLADLHRSDAPTVTVETERATLEAPPDASAPRSDATPTPVTRAVALSARLPMGPVQGPVSSPFGWRRHPVSDRVRHHDGVDLAVPAGTAVWTVAPGRVRSVGRRRGYGLAIEIDHPVGLGRRPVRTLYAHLSAVDAALRPGSPVARGQAIGASGGRPGLDGVSTGAHLHFEILDASGELLDPGRFVRLLDAVPTSGGVPRRFVPRRFAPRAATASAARQEMAEAPPAVRDTVDIWPAVAPELPRSEDLPDLVLPAYPMPAGQPSGPAATASASPDPS